MTIKLQKKIAIINDLSGYGRCSLTVAIPVISAMKVQCCPVPTSILSNHTAYPSYFFDDYTKQMIPYLEEWKKLDLHFDGIATGFLGSKEQIAIVADMIRHFKAPDTIVLVDPVMGDHGKPYQTYTESMCQEMKQLVGCGDIITPNLTEACILSDTEYRKNSWTQAELTAMTDKLRSLGPESVVITGVEQGIYLTNVIAEKDHPVVFQKTKKVGCERFGTGDVFSSILAANMVKGVPLTDSVRQAAVFVKKCIQKSEEWEIPLTDGVCFEELLQLLMK